MVPAQYMEEVEPVSAVRPLAVELEMDRELQPFLHRDWGG
jgi:hypothetical protein